MTIDLEIAAVTGRESSCEWGLGKFVPNANARLKDQFNEVARFKYLSQRTEDSYWQWVVRFLKVQWKKLTLQLRPHPQPLSHPLDA